MGLLNKYVIETNIPDDPNWYRFPTSDPGDVFMFNRQGDGAADNTFTEYLNWQYVSRRAASNATLYAMGARQARVAIGFASGAAAAALSDMSDYQVKAYLMSNFSTMFPNVTWPARFMRTSWDKDVFAYGSYSYNPVGSKSSDRKVYLDPTAAGTGCAGLLFAGEHADFVDFGTLHGAITSGKRAGASIALSAYTGVVPAARRELHEVNKHLSPADWARHLSAQLPLTPQLARVLRSRKAILDSHLAEGNLRAALDMAHAARGFSRALLPAGSEDLLERWVSFVAPKIVSIAGTPLEGGSETALSLTKRLVVMPDGRTLRLLSMGSVFTGGLPEAGLDMPVSGFEQDGKFYATEEAHDCAAGEAGVGVLCSIGGGPVAYFASEKEAARSSERQRSAGMHRYLAASKVQARPASLTWTAEDHHAAQDEAAAVRAGGARALSTASAELAVYAGRVDPYINNRMKPVAGAAMFNAGFTGNRTTLIISVVWSDYVWTAQSPTDATLTTPAELALGAADFTRVGLHTFGKLTPIVTASPCVYRLGAPFTTAYATNKATGPDSDSWLPALEAAAAAAVVAGGTGADGTACPALDPAKFHNFGVFEPSVPNCGWGGIAYTPGRFSAYNGKGSRDTNMHLLAHEIGHNYGHLHCSALPICVSCPTTKSIEYGDYLSTHGSGPVFFLADYNALEKHAAGWIDDSRVVNMALRQPAWTGSALGGGLSFYSSVTVDLAAYDRESPSYNGNDELTYLPAGTALAARAAVPPSWTSLSPTFNPAFSRANPFFLYIAFMGADWTYTRPSAPPKIDSTQFKGVLAGKVGMPGIYLRSAHLSPTVSGHTLLLCYRDSSCTSEYPLEANDALVYDPFGVALLVEAKEFKALAIYPNVAGGVNSPSQNGAMTTRIVYLNWNGLPVSGGGAATYTPTIVTGDAAGAATSSLSAGTAVFVYKPAAAGSFVVTPSCSVATVVAGVSDPGLVGFSIFVGAFPTAHAMYGGNVGYSGDQNIPATGTSTCGQPFLIQAGPNDPVWVVAANAGSKKGPSQVSVTLTAAAATSSATLSTTAFQIIGACNATPTGTTYATEYEAHTNSNGAAWSLTLNAAGCAAVNNVPAGPSRFPGVTYAAVCDSSKPVYTATTPGWSGGYAVYCAQINGDASKCTWVFDGAQQPLGNAGGEFISEPICFLKFAPAALITSCPAALSSPQYFTGTPTCGAVCPLGQTSDTGQAKHCRCPLGWTYTASADRMATTCAGKHLGPAPYGVAPVGVSSSTYENWAQDQCKGKANTL